jgi:outer membrane cobalamin receptor
MRTLLATCAASLLATDLLVSSALGDKPIGQHDKQSDERTVFVTGSLIPQRIKRKSIGTTTVSPVRIIDRHEIDATGRRTTRGVLIADPSVSATGR